MMCDVEGGIWVLINLGGVNYLVKLIKRFDYYFFVYWDGGVVVGKVVGFFCENVVGDIWVGICDGLCFFDVFIY